METKTIQIDGATYHIGRLAPRRATRLMNRLIRDVGPGIVPLVKDVPLKADGQPDIGAIDLGTVGAAVQGLLVQLNPDEVDAIMEELFSAVSVIQGGRVAPVMDVFDSHFDGRLGAIYKLMWAALQENFGGFFAPLIAAAGTFARAVVSKASSTSATSGSSGGSS